MNFLELFRFPPLKGNILVVGDGDFAYSVALAEANERGGSATIIASYLDTKRVVERKYPRTKNHLNCLSADANVVVTHGLDATKPTEHFNGPLWDSIIWNFPYTNTERPSRGELRSLLRKVLTNTSASLKQEGAFYISLTKASACKNSWNLEGLASVSGMEVECIMKFDPRQINGYEPKFSVRDTNVSYNSSSCRTFVLRRKKKECTADQVYELLLENEGIVRLDQFKYAYEQRYNRVPFPFGGKVKNKIEHLSELDGRFSLEVGYVGANQILDIVAMCTAETVYQLLLENDGWLYLNQFQNCYEQYYGRKPFPSTRKLKKKIECLSKVDKRFCVNVSGTVAVVCTRNN